MQHLGVLVGLRLGLVDVEREGRRRRHRRVLALAEAGADMVAIDLNEKGAHDVAKEIELYSSILSDRSHLLRLLKAELLEVKEKFATPRRSKFSEDDPGLEDEAFVLSTKPKWQKPQSRSFLSRRLIVSVWYTSTWF